MTAKIKLQRKTPNGIQRRIVEHDGIFLAKYHADSRWRRGRLIVQMMVSNLQTYLNRQRKQSGWNQEGVKTGDDRRARDLRVAHDFGNGQRSQRDSSNELGWDLRSTDRQHAFQQTYREPNTLSVRCCHEMNSNSSGEHSEAE